MNQPSFTSLIVTYNSGSEIFDLLGDLLSKCGGHRRSSVSVVGYTHRAGVRSFRRAALESPAKRAGCRSI